ncbi:short-chain dehydrogenase [Prauserella marina]|uniref:3-oxoacyl-[acyl-carrier protein] reductase n=1 Tax=Prauserella marina TaxID=530584 RepID=A0A222VPB4_9PSEU|nr:SDR family oxidoreductase [Prauserella marina]ASR35759.1 short-chain dehydrogenase [Prauserella marina]PWV84350.1 3-oxoacyl-[acyl-carrier protein] reductase [Prauserella marina]SDC24735.1 3-oxoacyl-[acyl-carrier protein] reductase [Prauserella marina]
MINTRLAGQTVLVTGGAGNIGAAISRAFAAQGARVAIHYLAQDLPAPSGAEWAHVTPAAAEADTLAEELGNGSFAVSADLSEPVGAERLVREVASRAGSINVLVNNAAHCESPDTIDTVTRGSLERHYLVNSVAPALLTAEVVRSRRDEDPLCVVNITTDAARAFPGQTGYGTSKAALEALTRSTALDLAARGIRVNAVAPGPVQTGWIADDLLDQARAIVPMGRVGEPEDIADAVVYLASHQARWITGQVVQVAGGHAL